MSIIAGFENQLCLYHNRTILTLKNVLLPVYSVNNITVIKFLDIYFLYDVNYLFLLLLLFLYTIFTIIYRVLLYSLRIICTNNTQ